MGRGRELRWLESIAASFDDEGVACAAALVGPAGVGKTRLLRELLGRHPTKRAFRAQGNPIVRREPMGVVAELARAMLGLRATTDPDARREAVDRWARTHAETTLDDTRVHLGRLVGAAPPSDGPAARRFAEVADDPGRFASAGRDVFVALLESETREAPTWLIVDDVHWVDAASLRALRESVSRLGERPLVVLVAGRSAPRATCGRSSPSASSRPGMRRRSCGGFDRRSRTRASKRSSYMPPETRCSSGSSRIATRTRRSPSRCSRWRKRVCRGCRGARAEPRVRCRSWR
ncbi:MAG: ATP-binding protein [Sandaracinus sp.]|nr:ATP-binding protein [Sandaracinus sp.]